jgi:hypothetical protein
MQLFVTSLIARTISYCLAHSITQVDYFVPESLQELLTPFLTALHEREIQVKWIICDGATYQLKALDFRDAVSIEAMNSQIPLFSRVLFIPCLDQRLNKTYLRVVPDSPNLNKVIDPVHVLARFSGKPNQRRVIGEMCRTFTETTRPDDNRILGFLLHHADAINEPSGAYNLVTAALSESQEVFSILYESMVALESSNTPVPRGYRLIAEGVTKLIDSAEQCCEPVISDIYLAATRGVTKYYSSRYSIFPSWRMY